MEKADLRKLSFALYLSTDGVEPPLLTKTISYRFLGSVCVSRDWTQECIHFSPWKKSTIADSRIFENDKGCLPFKMEAIATRSL